LLPRALRASLRLPFGVPPMTDWNPAAYARFAGLRLRPALDLLAQVPGDLPEGPVIDLGCGNGPAGPVLKARFAGRALWGLDASPAMLEAARATGAYDRLVQGDLAGWRPEAPPALVFSNAVLQWLGDHAALMPRLAGLVAPGGVLAVQMPGQHDAPSHALARETARQLFCDRFPAAAPAPVGTPQDYWRLLAPLGAITAWETTYTQHLGPVAQGHPVRAFTESTLLRPILERLDAGEQARYLATYDAALAEAYPLMHDGGALFPFRRVFLVLQVTHGRA
jgi:trans-aconitate 2-methyltransferase